MQGTSNPSVCPEIRMKEHQDEADEASNKHFTRAQRKASESTLNKSAITDHVASTSHTIDWEESKILAREPHRTRRWIRESIHIVKEDGHTMNRDMGNYQLPRIYHSLTRPPPPPGGGPTKLASLQHRSVGCELHQQPSHNKVTFLDLQFDKDHSP